MNRKRKDGQTRKSMIEIKAACAMCGKEKLNSRKTDDINKLNCMEIQEWLEKNGWIVQLNGSSFDVYCSTKCAHLDKPARV